MPTYPTTTENRIRHLAVFMLCLTPWHSLAGGHNSTKAQGTYQAAAILGNLSGNGSGPHPSGTNVSATQTAPQKHGSGWLPRNSTAWHNSSGSRELSRKQKARQFHHLQKTIKAQKGRHVADLPPRTTAQPGSFAVRTGNGLKLETRRQRQRREASWGGGVVFVGNDNFNSTVSNNCSGHFKLDEDVTLRDLKEPVCPKFNGTLESDGHRLSLIQTSDNVTSSGLFGSLDNAHVNLTLGDVRVDKAGYNCAVADRLGSNNTAFVRGGQVNVTDSGDNLSYGGVFGVMGGSHNSVEQENMQIHIKSDAVVQGIGGVGEVAESNNILKQKNVNITAKGPLTDGASSGGFGQLGGHNIHLDQRNVTVNAEGLWCGGGIGRIGHGSRKITLIQIGIQISHLKTSPRGSLGTAYGGAQGSTEIKLRLFSGNAGKYPVCGGTHESSEVTGFIDLAGYAAGSTSSCGGLKPLDTTNSSQWRDAHRYLCDTPSNPNQTSCHYPHEQLVDAVHGENGTLWLVSRQSYPYKNESDPNGLVRITGLNLSGVPNPTLNTSFSYEGIQLLSNASNQSLPLPDDMRPTAWSASQDKLVALYPSEEHQKIRLASFPLNHTEDGADKSTYAFVDVTNVTGTPVHLTREGEDSYTIWTRKNNGTAEDIVRRYQVKESLEAGFKVVNDSEYNLTLTVNPSAWVLGMGSANDLLYLVHQQNGSDILLDRIDMQTGEMFDRNPLTNLTLPEVPDPDAGLNYIVYPQGDGTVLLLPRRSVLAAFAPGRGRLIKVTLPEFGGRAEWQTLGEVALYITEQDPDSPDNPSNSGSNAGGIAAGVVVAGAGVLTTATALGVACSCKHSKMCKRCRKQVRQKVSLGKGLKSRLHSAKYSVQNRGDST